MTGGRASRELELAANFDLSAGKKHALRFGLLLRDLSVTSDEQRNAAGSYTFADLSSYEAGRPSLFTQRSGDPRIEFGQRQVGFYIQDEAKLSKALTLSGGLRLEGQSQVGAVFNLAPRASLVYALGPRTKLRAGVGRFFDWYEADAYEQSVRLDGQREAEASLMNPAWPDPSSVTNAPSSRSTRILTSPDLGLPRTPRASAGIDRNLTARIRLTADYTYQRGSRELRSRNHSVPGGSLSVREIESTAKSRTHTADVRMNLMPSPGSRGGFFVGYLWQSATNEANGALSLPADETRLADEWGRSLSDARHRVFGLLSLRPTRQISLGALIFVESGKPFDITTGRDDNGDTLFNDRPEGVTRNTGVAPSRINVDLRVGWSKSFGGARPQRPGEGVRLIRVGEGDGVPDTSGGGDPQRYRVSVYLQAFNALNRTNPVAVGTVFGSPFFGQPILTDPGRRIELGVTFSF